MQAEFDFNNTKEFVTSPTVKLEKEKYSSESEAKVAREYASQLRAQVKYLSYLVQVFSFEKIVRHFLDNYK